MGNTQEVCLELETAVSLSRVVPIDVDEEAIIQTRTSLARLFQLTNINHGVSIKDASSFGGSSAPLPDDWLPITQSRTGNSFTAALHLLCSGLGLQSLLIPVAFVSLGWVWGSVCLGVMMGWQLYTTWILVHLHEPEPCSKQTMTAPRYSRYLVLSIIAFGPTLGKLLAIFPTMYLSGGTCVLFIITGGGIMDFLSQLLSSDDDSSTITGAEWFLIFICIAILVSQFFPTLDSFASVSLVGSVSAVLCFSLLWIVSISTSTKQQPLLAPTPSTPELLQDKTIRGTIDAIGMIALTFRGHNLILEIQGTMPASQQRPARNIMWKGVTASYVIIGLCIFPLAIGGHWAFGNKMGVTTKNGGILDALTSKLSSHHHKTSTHKWILATIHITMLLHLICAFQLYAMPALDNLERVIYVSKNNKACPRWVRSGIRLLYGVITYFIAAAFPFIGSLGPFFGAVSLPLTFAYPCFMWIAMEKRKSHRWKWSKSVHLGIGCMGIGLSLVLGGAALWNLVDYGLNANFFKPR